MGIIRSLSSAIIIAIVAVGLSVSSTKAATLIINASFGNLTGATGRIPTLILDEVDAGIGGQTAKILGEKLRRMAHSHQIFCITHLPQIASYGDQHYRVEKAMRAKQSKIRVTPLNFTERIEEIARMSSGEQITETTRKHAEEMLTKRP